MRYFKYKNTNKTEYISIKEQYTALNKEEKKIFRKQKILKKLGTVIFFSLAIILSICGFIMVDRVSEPDDIVLYILLVLGKVLMWFGVFVVSTIIALLVATPFWTKASTNFATEKKEVLSKACAHLREYYGLQEPCLVTKCYDCDDEKFIDHDVCIFVTDNELRITTNLKHGFVYAENDLGCYAFERDELTISEIHMDKYIATELKTNNFRFLLGRRSDSFIRKTFIFPEQNLPYQE